MHARMRLLIVNTGTICDGNLMSGFIHDPLHGLLHGGNEIIYLTDEGMKVEKKEGLKLFTYSTPDFIYTDPMLGASDPQRNPVTWALAHPLQARRSYEWVAMLAARIKELEDRYEPECVLVHFSLLPSLMIMEREAPLSVLASRPHLLIYLYPGIPNATLPWLFDSRLRDRDFPLYSHSRSPKKTTLPDVVDSWNTIMARIAMGKRAKSNPREDLRNMHDVSRALHHAVCWDAEITRPLAKLVPGLVARYIGSPPLSLRGNVPPAVASFLSANKGNHKTAFVSFGSFGKVSALRKVAEITVSHLVVRLGWSVLVHDTCTGPDCAEFSHEDSRDSRDSRRLLVQRGFIPYGDVVPSMGLVVFTGSMCLQLVCLQNATPMLFVPYLTEQYLWAKNYEAFTHVPYVSVDEPDSAGQVTKAFKALRSNESNIRLVSEYLNTVRASLKHQKSAKALRELVQGLVRERRERDVGGFLF